MISLSKFLFHYPTRKGPAKKAIARPVKAGSHNPHSHLIQPSGSQINHHQEPAIMNLPSREALPCLATITTLSHMYQMIQLNVIAINIICLATVYLCSYNKQLLAIYGCNINS